MHKHYGLLGRKLSHSISPKIHEMIFKHTDLEGDYALYPTEPQDIECFIKHLIEKDISGLNVTIPYKSDVMDFLDDISCEVQKIGAVNTILPTTIGIHGYNTDYFGVKCMLDFAKIECKNKKVMVLGTGGSARTVVALLKDFHAQQITLVSRNKQRTQNIFKDLQVIDYSEINNNHMGDILINTTPVGMYPNIDGCPLDDVIIKSFGEVVDLIYNPIETRLLSIARQNGAKHVNGLYMLIAQAVKAQMIWNDCLISDNVIEDIYNELKETQYV
ncbi:MAG: shikimate dehydrogenase [Clostridiales bacterium]|nr:shikimate dehydrogenase [Clostridiales bacterium]